MAVLFVAHCGAAHPRCVVVDDRRLSLEVGRSFVCVPRGDEYHCHGLVLGLDGAEHVFRVPDGSVVRAGPADCPAPCAWTAADELVCWAGTEVRRFSDVEHAVCGPAYLCAVAAGSMTCEFFDSHLLSPRLYPPPNTRWTIGLTAEERRGGALFAQARSVCRLDASAESAWCWSMVGEHGVPSESTVSLVAPEYRGATDVAGMLDLTGYHLRTNGCARRASGEFFCRVVAGVDDGAFEFSGVGMVEAVTTDGALAVRGEDGRLHVRTSPGEFVPWNEPRVVSECVADVDASGSALCYVDGESKLWCMGHREVGIFGDPAEGYAGEFIEVALP